MVLQKRLEHGSSGYHVPPMPRVPRAARGKRSIRKKHEDKQISAFDLLATVAEELLSEQENSPPPCKLPETSNSIPMNDSIKQEQQDNEIPFKAEVFDQGSCNESTLASEILSKKQPQTPKSIEKDSEEVVLGGKRKEFGCSLPPISKKCCTEVEVKTPLQTERRVAVNAIDVNSPEILVDPMYLDANKPPALVSSDSSVEVPISRNGSFPNLPVDRDDDENSSGCTHPCTNISKAFRPQRIGDRRIRKLLASKYWKVPQTTLKNEEILNIDVEMRSVLRSRKMCYTRQRTQRSFFKRRKLFERRSISEAVSNSLKLGGIKMEASAAHASLNGASGPSSSTSGQKSSYESGDCHVKLNIKSFKVPELFIEIPETATVGSLKKTVMEAVTAILAGGLRVGVLLQGKKVRDDKQTLFQAGISRNDRMDNLGFTLEPNSTQAPSLTCSEDLNSLLPSNPVLPIPPTEVIQSIPAVGPVADQMPPETAPEPPQASNMNSHGSDHESVQSPTSSILPDTREDAKAIVPVPAMNSDALAMVPLRNKPKRSELVQRRIRRPFSVTEVEALVQAVEKLGTGRWRDVKIRAFDNAKHRTYVDLKDKWKTLVHTARISPQQRRGEPVPQELLDRVLSAHAYWAHQQAKLQAKPTQSEACLT